MKKAININIIQCHGRMPLFKWYAGQCRPQSAYIELDCDERTLSADWNGEIGNAVPAHVWHDRVLRFDVSENLKCREINYLLKEIAPLAGRICDGYELDWDGNNMVGTYNDDAKSAIASIERYIEEEGWN